jgi:hypothetical protein
MLGDGIARCGGALIQDPTNYGRMFCVNDFILFKLILPVNRVFIFQFFRDLRRQCRSLRSYG